MTNWWYFSYFSQKTAFDISCKLSPMETICMKCQILFSGKNKKNISLCRLLKILPSVATEHITWHMVPSFLYDRTKSAQSGTPLPWNPSWSTDNFLKRWPDLKLNKPQSLEWVRAKSATKEVIDKYYTEREATFSEHNLLDKPHFVYTINETGISTDHSPTKIVAKIASKPQSVVVP